MNHSDIVIIGAGIAGAALAHALLVARPQLALTILEAESHPGYHTTGRSAAFFAETYGGPLIQPLTTASRAFLARPPAGFCDGPLLSPRGALHICHPDQRHLLADLEAEFEAGHVDYRRLDAHDLAKLAPWLKPAWAMAAIHEPGCTDIDVAGLHQACLRHVRRAGSAIVCAAPVRAITRRGNGWQVQTAAGVFHAPLLVNAAGAWVDEVAAMAGIAPIGIQPLRRTIAVAEVQPPSVPDMPMVMDAGGSLYFKPDGGRLWISPHDETPDTPHDVRPEEVDVAIAIDRFLTMCDWPVRRLTATWAGLRNFAPDRLPVLGADPADAAFFWCAGQGGWGIQTAPAASALLASLILQEPLPAQYHGFDAGRYLPGRLR